MFIKDIPNSKLNAFHLNVVYFQSDGKGTLRISSFVFSPLNCVFFFLSHIKIAYFICSSEVCCLYRARISIEGENGKRERVE